METEVTFKKYKGYDCKILYDTLMKNWIASTNINGVIYNCHGATMQIALDNLISYINETDKRISDEKCIDKYKDNEELFEFIENEIYKHAFFVATIDDKLDYIDDKLNVIEDQNKKLNEKLDTIIGCLCQTEIKNYNNEKTKKETSMIVSVLDKPAYIYRFSSSGK